MGLSLDALLEEIGAFAATWTVGKRFDSGASRRATVESVLLTTTVGQHVGVREAWVAQTPSGDREIDAQLWRVQPKTFEQKDLTHVRTLEEVRTFLAKLNG